MAGMKWTVVLLVADWDSRLSRRLLPRLCPVSFWRQRAESSTWSNESGSVLVLRSEPQPGDALLPDVGVVEPPGVAELGEDEFGAHGEDLGGHLTLQWVALLQTDGVGLPGELRPHFFQTAARVRLRCVANLGGVTDVGELTICVLHSLYRLVQSADRSSSRESGSVLVLGIGTTVGRSLLLDLGVVEPPGVTELGVSPHRRSQPPPVSEDLRSYSFLLSPSGVPGI